ncbi:MAG: DNA gyrase subunit A [Chloroflexi bacterium]|nr:DNA gyrase subunit A [Chloroflexota bacterium]
MVEEAQHDREVRIEDEMQTSYLSYSLSAIRRATPDVRDGLKPVHRRVLFGMLELGLRHTSGFRKSAKVVGEVMGKYHPHGDAAIYDTLVRLAQPFSMRYPLVDGQGNFGSVDGDAPAAMRYTEVRLTALAEEMLTDIDQDTVDFLDNFDSTEREPTVLPTRVPNYLVNGSVGIAVGMATNVPPHNLREICDALIYLADDPNVSVDELTSIITGPDFPTGGLILGRDGIRQIYATGHGRITLRAVCEIEQLRGGRTAIVAKELPFQVNKAQLLESVADHIKNKRLDGISDIRDESDREGTRAVFELRRDAQPRKILNALFKHTALQQNYTVNMLAIVHDEPRVLSLKRCLQEFLTFRQEVIIRRTRYQLRRAQDRAHILEGLTRALDMIDAVIALIRRSPTTDAAIKSLQTEMQFTEAQARAIAALTLGRLANLERQRILDEYKTLLETIKELEAILGDVGKVTALIKTELTELRDKYGDARHTHIIDESGELTEEDLIPHQQMLITLTTHGYVKRMQMGEFPQRRRGGRGRLGMVSRTEDAIQYGFAADTLDTLLFFTNRGRVFAIKAHEVPEASRTGRGVALMNVIAIEQNESISALLPIKSLARGDQRFLVMATRHGSVKKTSLSEYANVRKNGLIALSLADGDELAWVHPTDGTQDVLLVTEHGHTICFSEAEIRSTARATSGVRGITLEEGDRVISMAVVPPQSRRTGIYDLLVVTALGFGKRTPINDYRTQGRSGRGVITAKLSDKTGLLVAGLVVTDDAEDLVLSTSNGIVNRQPINTVRQVGRNTQGVTLIRLDEQDAVTAATLISRTSYDD